ncbi:alpha/beta hydrolase [Riemerella anatipestifer]|nr:alpha/beta hydrolase [Riemerella anatipestifer]MDY3358736.1 alpha/beta hydrolase [Riemerella anatipestifer]
MIKRFQIILLIVLYIYIRGQNIDIREFYLNYKGTRVEYIVLSKKGEKDIKKPLLVFCQGSLAQPIIRVNDNGIMPLFPFEENILLDNFHVIIISKPGIPLKVNIINLKSDFSFPKNGNPPVEYIRNNNLNYYYKRNNFIVSKLIKNKWVDSSKIVVAGHSEGSYIALKMAKHNTLITHLIYSGGNPLGRMMSIINYDRISKNEKQSFVQEDLDFWKKIVYNKDIEDYSNENTYKYHYLLSKNFIPDLLQLKIPILVTYGTGDQNGIFNDYLQVIAIENRKLNFTFKSYFKTDHNFFPIDEDGNINHNINNWNNVVEDWVYWYKNN